MGERKYLLADISRKLNIAPYMLRYYEDALAISIPRNERGLRYYGRHELELFASVIKLEQKGFQLPAIKLVLDDIHRIEKLPCDKLIELRDRLDMCTGENKCKTNSENYKNTFAAGYYKKEVINGEGSTSICEKAEDLSTDTADDRMDRFRSIMLDIMSDALKQNNDELGRMINYTVTDSVVREMNFIMERKEEAAEERYKMIDKRLREICAVKENRMQKKGAL